MHVITGTWSCKQNGRRSKKSCGGKFFTSSFWTEACRHFDGHEPWMTPWLVRPQEDGFASNLLLVHLWWAQKLSWVDSTVVSDKGMLAADAMAIP